MGKQGQYGPDDRPGTTGTYTGKGGGFWWTVLPYLVGGLLAYAAIRARCWPLGG